MVGRIEEIELSKIDRPKDIARIQIDEEYINELAQSIEERGQLEPIRVRERDGRYEIVFGDRRFLACKKLGVKTIDAVIVECTSAAGLIDRTIENVQRVDLTPIEEAKEYYRLVKEMDLSFGRIAKLTGKSPGSVKRSLKLLKMPAYMQKALHQKKISRSVAEVLVGIADDSSRQYHVEMAAEHGVTREVATTWVYDWKKSLRKFGAAGDDEGEVRVSSEPEPSYMTCYLCKGAVEVGKAVSVTSCKECWTELEKIVRR